MKLQEFSRILFLSALLTLWANSLLFAGAEDAGEAVQLEEIRVISSPIIEGNLVDAYGSVSTIVTEDQIKHLNAQDIGTALRRTPGVTISRYNPIGSFGGAEGGGIFIRGMGSSRPGSEIKTFIDGVPMFMGVWNHPLLDLLSVDTASAIEIHKSPQPHLFGNAFAAINIVPKKKTTEGFRTQLHLAGGSYDTLIQRAEHAGKTGSTDYYLGQSFRTSKGHRTKSDGEVTNYFARIGRELGENWYTSAFGLYTDNYAWDPGEKGADPMEREGKYGTEALMGAINLAHDYSNARGSIRVYANQGEGQQLSRPDGRPDAIWEFEYYGVRGREELNLWPGGEVVLGFDHDITKGEGGSRGNMWEGHTQRITSPYVAVNHLLGEKDGFYAIPSAGIRYYKHNRLPSESAPHAGLVLGYQNTQIHAGYARGVIYPGLEVLILSKYVNPMLGDSWRDLEAETLDHYEIGISHTWPLLRADLTFFRDEGENRYLIVPPPPPPPVFANIGEYRIQGVEATVNYMPVADVSLFLASTFLDSDPGDLPYAPDRTYTAGFNWQLLRDLWISMDGQYVSGMHVTSQARREGAVNEAEVSSYYLINGKVSYLLRPRSYNLDIEMFVFGENLTDKSYAYRPGYPMPGINGMAGVTFIF